MQYRPTNISSGFDKFSIARLAYNAGVHDVPRCPRYNRLLLYIEASGMMIFIKYRKYIATEIRQDETPKHSDIKLIEDHT
jgi:hypothetical protein